MSLPSSLVVGRLHLEQGLRQDNPRTVDIFEPRSFLRRQDPGIFFVLIDLLSHSPHDDALLAKLIKAAELAYDQTPGSVTRGLRQAVLTVNRHLRNWNRERASGRQAAGITCAVMVDDEVYLAQAGPSLAFIAQPGAIERYPTESPWLSEAPLETVPRGLWAPLGLRDDIYVDLSFAQIGPGYTVLLASAHLLQLLPEDELIPLIDQDPEDILLDLSAIASGQDLSALVASLLEPEPADAMPVEEEPRVPSGPGLGRRVAMATRRGMVAAGSAGATVLGGIARILEQLLPEPIEEEREPSERRRLALMWLAIVIPAIVILLTIAMYWTRGGSGRAAQSVSLVQAASAQVEEARALSDTNSDRALELLLAASRDLDRALDLRPSNEEAQQLKAEIQSELETLQGIVRLSEVTPVASLPGQANDRRRLVVQGTTAYVLNNREQVVRRVGLGSQRVVEALRSDEAPTEQPVGPLVDMAWVPAGGVRDQAAAIVLDSAGTAWQLDTAGDVVPLRVAGTDAWEGLRLIGGFAGNLYVLDVGLGQILKYSPTVDGYAVPPVEWMSADASLRLEDVVDMAINGAIYLLQSSGRVEKLIAGEPAPFDQPNEFDLSQPVVCFANAQTNAVYIADTTRIFQFDDAGVFQRQLLPPDGRWNRLSALWVDEANGWLYAVDAGRLVMAPLPPE